MIVDTDRSFEKQCDVNEISTSNIHQTRVLTPGGKVVSAGGGNLEAAADKALEGAKWKIEPDGIPQTLRQAWISLEFGNYTGAAASIQRAKSKGSDEEKAAAERLDSVVQVKINEQVNAARSAAEDKENWKAYKLYMSVAQTFRGFPVSIEAAKTARELTKDAKVKAELTADRVLRSAMTMVSAQGAKRRRGLTMLKGIPEKFPDTEAAAEAAALSEKLGTE
jgi:hypothetical protein